MRNLVLAGAAALALIASAAADTPDRNMETEAVARARAELEASCTGFYITLRDKGEAEGAPTSDINKAQSYGAWALLMAAKAYETAGEPNSLTLALTRYHVHRQKWRQAFAAERANQAEIDNCINLAYDIGDYAGKARAFAEEKDFDLDQLLRWIIANLGPPQPVETPTQQPTPQAPQIAQAAPRIEPAAPAPRIEPAPEPEPTPLSSPWTVTRSTSRIDDSPTIILRTKSKNSIPDQFGLGAVRPELAIRCHESKLDLIVAWGLFISMSPHIVEWRLDKDPAKSDRWSVSTNYESIGLWGVQESAPVINSMIGHRSMVVRTQPFGRGEVTAEFNISDLRRYISEPLQACGITLRE